MIKNTSSNLLCPTSIEELRYLNILDQTDKELYQSVVRSNQLYYQSHGNGNRARSRAVSLLKSSINMMEILSDGKDFGKYNLLISLRSPSSL